MLIRTTLIALNQANETGNYSVLHGLAGPGLRGSTSPESLAEALGSFRAKRVNLSPVAVVSPILEQPPAMGRDGLLHLAGIFPTKPFAVRFNLAFSLSEQGWRMEGLNVDAAPAPPGRKAGPKADFDASAFLPKRNPPPKPRRIPKAAANPSPLDHSTDPPTTTAY